MQRTLVNIAICITALLVASGCSTTARLLAGDALYTGADVRVADRQVNKKERKKIVSESEGLVRPLPNKKVLGIPFKLLLYNMAGNPKRENSLAGKMKYKWGEPPVLLSSVNLDFNNRVLQSTLENQGYFNSVVTGDTVVHKKKARAVYEVTAGSRYVIKDVILEKDSSVLLGDIAASFDNTLLKQGQYFNLSVIRAERERIDAFLKERGYYYFDPDFLIVEADSTIGDHRVNLYVKVKKTAPPPARNPYTINNIYIYPGYRLSGGQQDDTLHRGAVYYNGYYLVDRGNTYKPKMFAQAVRFSSGDVYNRRSHLQSINRLINLGVFKFVKNNFEAKQVNDSSKLDVYYYLTSLPRKSIRLDINANTKSNNLAGSAVTFSWRNRNTFRAGELLTINATGGFEVQFSGQLRGFNTYRGGLESKLTFPRFIIPFVNINTRSGFMPKTNLLLAYDILTKERLYTMNSFRAGFGYAWKETLTKEHEVNPIAINLVQPLNISQLYADSILTNPALGKVVERQFIIGSNYNFNYNELTGSGVLKGLYFNANLDLSGNIAGLLTRAGSGGNPKSILGAVFSQYTRVETDIRYYIKLSSKSNWANRIIAGVGVPYGNSTELPFIKQFFAGGTNSIRAFRSRALGPGTYYSGDNNRILPDQSGDIKLELNTELRAKLFSIVHGALFIDAGNIWLYNANPGKPGGGFTKNFLKEMAVGAGAGIRFDISFLVLRLDVAFPIRKPWLPENERWVIDQINFGNSNWLRQNLVYNIGIGYPF
ncbi:MAG: BamA/TamA family outer membrane protein [Chitinophagaceae bacterium]|nr:BamA/TamA family outer membrane protein [Chitinophagaceae bacterium]MCW5927820.1 BamA/TamA family outer membrane protein [Chitinophagaceae bacterium]